MRKYTHVCMKKVKEDKSKDILVSRNCKNVKTKKKKQLKILCAYMYKINTRVMAIAKHK